MTMPPSDTMIATTTSNGELRHLGRYLYCSCIAASFAVLIVVTSCDDLGVHVGFVQVSSHGAIGSTLPRQRFVTPYYHSSQHSRW